ncbi:LOB domain-containing protein 20 [Dorcoceras hygrometricum]|uniref:LOB domain-containing protein 20 n=1 Tax=Dorcoceras hygrometricum TaxID=472368 RepID=A0A2Z7BIQ4_9LAMI|nr:LOB domain-containing protein 20 [Dorcoceras hygrometricum]
MDHEPQSNSTRRRGSGKIRGGATARQVEAMAATEAVVAQHGAPCGACKFLRRKCVSGCVFAPHFASDQGAARFAAVHKVFGASNVSKLLLHIPANRRHDAVVTIGYEAQARLSDPVYGCVSTIMALQQQVSSLQAELSMVQTQLINSKLVSSNAFQCSAAQQHNPAAMLQQPAYSNTSSASNNLINFGNAFAGPNFGETTATSTCFEPGIHHMYKRGYPGRDEDDEDEEPAHDQVSFTNHIFP